MDSNSSSKPSEKPRIISLKEDSEHYHPEYVHKVRILVDGFDRTRGCSVANEPDGYIISAVFGDDGNIIVDGNEFREEKVSGNVKIVYL